MSFDSMPNPFLFEDGSSVLTKEDWARRAEELRKIYQETMYGFWRTGEQVEYEISDAVPTLIDFFGPRPAEGAVSLTVRVSLPTSELGLRRAAWTLPVYLPDREKVPMPEGGYPFIIAMHSLPSMQYALDNGFAVLVNNSTLVAADDALRTGCFYDLYPYGGEPASQTGVLMAWAWGLSKILDAVRGGAGKALGLNPEKSIATGVSRYGKATAVLGAFDHRFLLTAPACSGAGGLALYRYRSEGKTYDLTQNFRVLSDKELAALSSTATGDDEAGASSETEAVSVSGASSEAKSHDGISDDAALTHYTYGQNEPLDCLQSDAERGWFNDAFLSFAAPQDLPVEQYELAALAATPGHAYCIIGAMTGEDWVNAPAMWECYQKARVIYDFLGLSDHLFCNFHKIGHAVLDEDLAVILPYFREHFM